MLILRTTPESGKFIPGLTIGGDPLSTLRIIARA